MQRTAGDIFKTLLVASVTAAAANAGVQTKEVKSFTVRDSGRLVVRAEIGDIEVRTSGSGKVAVMVIREAKTSSNARSKELLEKIITKISQQGETIQVQVLYPESHSWFNLGFDREVSARTIVTVPEKFNVDLSGAGGDISVDDLAGDVRLNTAGGELRMGRITGKVLAVTAGGDISMAQSLSSAELKTAGGDIEVGSSRGPLVVRTSGGDIEVLHSQGSVLARTSGGNIDLQDISGAIDASTSGGRITTVLADAPVANVRLASMGGPVTLYIPERSRFDFDAQSSGGRVAVDFGTAFAKSGEHRSDSEERVSGKVNGGGAKVVVRASGGNVKLLRTRS